MTISVVGIGAEGWAGLGERARSVIGAADVVVAAPRQLGLLPERLQFERITLPSPLKPNLPALVDSLAGRNAVVLASGDPLLSGIGSTLVELLGPVPIVPFVSSVALARAEMGWPAESCSWVSLVGRDAHLVLRRVAPGARILVLVSDGGTAATVAGLLTAAGYGSSALSVLSDLGSAQESRSDHTADRFAGTTAPLTVLAIECVGCDALGWVPGLPDDAFVHDGQITKRDARASALARLAPRPGELLWDVGAGAGSVAIEWLRVDPTCRAVAVERDPVRAANIRTNADALGVPGLQIVEGEAPAALDRLEPPNAVFVGGGATEPDLLDNCWNSLAPGGRLVVHGVTVQTEAVLGVRHAQIGGELVRLRVEHAEPLGGFTGWRPSRAVVQWAATKI